jgi:hypothetical protein
MGFFGFFQKRPAPPAGNERAVQEFLVDLRAVAPAAGGGSYAFKKSDGHARGFVQFIINSPSSLIIHRLWTLEPGAGNGSLMLAALCELADRHGVELRLKVVPIGRKPHPLSREQLFQWYHKHGFAGTHKKMIRAPRLTAAGTMTPTGFEPVSRP